MRQATVGLMLMLAAAGCGSTKDRADSERKPLLTQLEAEETVRKLPEVAAWADAVKGKSGGRVVPVTKAEHTPSDERIDGRRVWILYFGERHQKHMVLWNRFKVDAATGEVFIWQAASESYIPVLEWQKRLALEAGRPFPKE